jgi:hypothetical protein
VLSIDVRFEAAGEGADTAVETSLSLLLSFSLVFSSCCCWRAMLLDSVETMEDEGADEAAAATETLEDEEGEGVVDRGRVVALWSGVVSPLSLSLSLSGP